MSRRKRRQKSQGFCFYCSRKFVSVGVNSSQLHFGLEKTKDHFHPASLGGTLTVPCCRACNTIKGNMTPEEWGRFMTNNPNWWEGNWQRLAAMLQRERMLQRAAPPAHMTLNADGW